MQAYALLHFYSSSGQQIALPHFLIALKLKMSLVAIHKKHPKIDFLIFFNVAINTAGIKTTNKIYVSEVRIYNNNN
jgi:hypothetical protein